MKTGNKIFKWLVFIAYIVVLLYIVFFAEMFGRTDIPTGYRYNLVPFKEIKRFLIHFHQIGIVSVMLNLVGNVAAFIPLGYCLPQLTQKKCGLFNVFTNSVLLSALIEIIQLLTRVGSCDVDDIILNTLGGIVGYIIYCIVKRVFKKTGKTA